jgi:hypothetical protein
VDDVCKEMMREVQVIKERVDYKEGQRKKNFPHYINFLPRHRARNTLFGWFEHVMLGTSVPGNRIIRDSVYWLV